jgi:hypothetical protein
MYLFGYYAAAEYAVPAKRDPSIADRQSRPPKPTAKTDSHAGSQAGTSAANA